jgi:hypothetical protein
MGGSRGHQSDQNLPVQGSNTPQKAIADFQGAAAATCQVGYQTAQTAVEEYRAVNGRPPGSMAELQTVLRGPIASTRFTITIDMVHPGQIDVAAGGHAPQPGPANCAYAG